MLHGLAQSGEYFHSKTKGFRTAFENLGYTLYYPTAPNRFPSADLPVDDDSIDYGSIGNNTTDGNKIIAWLQNDITKTSYTLPDTTIVFLHDYIIENGPFDGIVGFSQGAGLAGYLATDINMLLNLTNVEQPELKFFISFSGFRFKPAQYQEQYDLNPIKIPSLHVKGDLDTITEPEKVESLFNSCLIDKRTMLIHPGGHFVPNSRGFVKKIINWIESLNI